MADNIKKDKIAAAKKKLKQFQQRSGRTPSRSPGRQTPTPPIASAGSSAGAGETPGHKSKRGRALISEQPETNITNRGRPVSKATGNLQTSDQSEPRTTASTESLQQLSRQLNGLLAESAEFTGDSDERVNASLEELERRNRELAALLEQHSQVNQQLDTQNQQLRDRATSLQEQLESEKNNFHEKYKKDVASLKEQLQVHIQTIGILVAEKTELQSQVGQSQRIADQRLEEIEELSGRLKASRQRVADLERSLSTSSQSGHQLEKVNREHAKEIDRLKLELYKSNKGLEEGQQQISELTLKLNSKVKEAEEQEGAIEDLKKRLEMAEIYAQQLSSETEGYAGNVKMITDLETERDSLLLQIKQHEETLLSVRQEKDQIRDHFQHNADQLTWQIQQLTKQMTALSEERERLLVKQHDLEVEMAELQHKLKDADDGKKKEQGGTGEAQAHLISELEQLRKDLQELQQRHEAQIRDNAQLSRFLEERELKVLELERQVEQMGSEAEDRTQLLESVQSDRTALSRALSQNKELKLQLAELQNGFVKMSNDNMELVTKLQAVEHTSNDMAARLATQEDDMKDLRELVSRKEQEVQSCREELQTVQRQQYHQDQIQDRLRHYEAQAQLVETLQNELTSAQDMMEALSTQNSELRTMLIRATEVKQHPHDSSESGAASPRDELIESLNASIRQLEVDRSQLYENLKEQRQLSDSLSVKVADLQEEVIRKSSDHVECDKISRSEYEQLKTAMEMIQEKYTRVMRDKAELSDKADQLEHLVVQLQGETDTIGEYISLYHHQRALLQQRELQKNEYICQLARDREQLQDKLGELQALVMQLLGERKMLHSYHEESSTGAHRPHNGHGSHHHHHHHHAPPDTAIQPHLVPHKPASMLNGPVENSYQDWPDYTSSESDTESEVEPIVGGTDNSPGSTSPAPSLAQEMSEEGVTAAPQHVHDHTHGAVQPHTHSHSSYTGVPSSCAIREEDQTAHRILNLLSELGHSNLVEKVPFTERNFLPCKYCKGAVQVI